MQTKKENYVNCPTCKNRVLYDISSPFRPFCSTICKDQDIISWAEERFRVLGSDTQQDQEPNADGIAHTEEDD